MPMTPPPGTKLIGNSIEWVIERPEVNGIQTNLALYTQSAWQKMFGYFPKSGALYRPSALPSGVLTTLIMDQNGIYVSIPTLYPGESDDAAWFNGIRVPLP
jgi:hypothetical protein